MQTLFLKRPRPSLLAVLSGVLLYAAWPVSPLTLLIFIAFVPLLWAEELCTTARQFFLVCYLTMLVWNGATTWWIYNSTAPGAIAAILANSFLMCIPWGGFYLIKKKFGARSGYLSLVFFWLSFEYIHLNWQLSWPWLTLGNAFAMHPQWVQWFSFTGTSGGSLWILAVNILLFTAVRQKIRHYPSFGRYLMLLLAALLLPAACSYLLPGPVAATGDTPEVVIVQPDIDPWDEKFVPGKEEEQIHQLIRLSASQTGSGPTLVVWPETAIPAAINESTLMQNHLLTPVLDFLEAHPSVNLLTGIEGFRLFNRQDKPAGAQRTENPEQYYESYNSAVLLSSDTFQVYHKSKLVPGVETLPPFLHFLDAWFEKFGGTASGYTSQAERTVLKTYNNTYKIAPAVCYESIYGEFMSAYVRNDADIIVVITNDGWWGNTAGYRQHMNYARLLAVETGRWVAHCANTGISCFISPEGQVMDPQPWDTIAAIKMKVPAIEGQTFFVQHGDILSRLTLACALLTILWSIIAWIKGRLRSSS